MLYIKEKLDLFLTIAKTDPIEAIKFVPEAAGGIAAVLVTLIAIVVGRSWRWRLRSVDRQGPCRLS